MVGWPSLPRPGVWGYVDRGVAPESAGSCAQPAPLHSQIDLVRRLSSNLTLATATNSAGGTLVGWTAPFMTVTLLQRTSRGTLNRGLCSEQLRSARNAMVGIRRYEVTVEGRADHAGTTPVHLRAACWWGLRISSVRSTIWPGPGRLRVLPGYLGGQVVTRTECHQ
jgi:hypothetical protein